MIDEALYGFRTELSDFVKADGSIPIQIVPYIVHYLYQHSRIMPYDDRGVQSKST